MAEVSCLFYIPLDVETNKTRDKSIEILLQNIPYLQFYNPPIFKLIKKKFNLTIDNNKVPSIKFIRKIPCIPPWFQFPSRSRLYSTEFLSFSLALSLSDSLSAIWLARYDCLLSLFGACSRARDDGDVCSGSSSLGFFSLSLFPESTPKREREREENALRWARGCSDAASTLSLIFSNPLARSCYPRFFVIPGFSRFSFFPQNVRFSVSLSLARFAHDEQKESDFPPIWFARERGSWESETVTALFANLIKGARARVKPESCCPRAKNFSRVFILSLSRSLALSSFVCAHLSAESLSRLCALSPRWWMGGGLYSRVINNSKVIKIMRP